MSFAPSSSQFVIGTSCTLMPDARAAARMASTCDLPEVGSHTNATCRAAGTASRSSCNHLTDIVVRSTKKPVTLPPGRAMFAIHPLAMGSVSRSIATIGIESVASIAALTAGGPIASTISALSRTKSAASFGRVSTFPKAERSSSTMFLPST